MHQRTKLFFGLVILLALTLCSACSHTSVAAEETESTAATEAPRQQKENIQTLLLACLDAYDAPRDSGTYRNDHQVDFLMLLIMDEELGTTTALQLNPDTLVSFSPQGLTEAVETPLGLVASYGSGGSDSLLSISKTVSNLLSGVSIDHYLSFTAESVAIVNDMLGGIVVTVTEDFPEEYPELLKGETVTLQGENAAAYFCYRNDEDVSNETHMTRQQQYVAAVYAPFMENAQQEDFLTSLTLQLGDGMTTDLTLSQMVQMLQSLGSYEMDENVVTLQGTTEVQEGQFQFHVDEESLEQIVESLFFD